jgi:TonB family protein
VRPQEWTTVAPARGTVRFQVTLDTGGRVAEIRQLGEAPVTFPPTTTVEESRLRAMSDAMRTSAANALRQWKYDPPGAPLRFLVAFNFSSTEEPSAYQQDEPAARGRGPGFIPPSQAQIPPPWPAAEGIPRVGGAIRPPTQVKRVTPVFPRDAQAERVGGVVIMEAIIGVDGRVRDVRVLRSAPLFDKAAVDAVRQWQYTPPLRDGTPTPVVMTVTVTFTLDGQSGGTVVAPPWPAAAGAVRVGGNIQAPRKTRDVRAVYPAAAQADRVSGAVTLELLIGPDGKVRDLRVLRSSPIFEKSAIDAARRWEYEPTLINGMPVSVVMATTVTFNLR